MNAISRAAVRTVAATSLALSAATACADTYPTADAAALEALRAAVHEGCNEYAGAIIAADGAYTYTEATRGKDDRFELHVHIPKGAHLAAIYHTHPACLGGKTTAMFSWDDVSTAERLGVVSYIAVAFDHTVRRFDPAHSKTRSLSVGASAIPYTVSDGTVLASWGGL